MKNLRIVSKTRFITFVVVVILVGSLSVAGMLGALTVHSSQADDFRKVEVQSGDTIWTIAEAYYPGEDVRKRVYDICQVNHVRAEELQAGQTLLLPLQ